MAHIVPFRALRYDPKRVTPSDVVTQPYDKITPQGQDRYYAASPYNLVRLILGKREPADNDSVRLSPRPRKFAVWNDSWPKKPSNSETPAPKVS